MKKNTSLPEMDLVEGLPADCIREQMLIRTRQWCLERVRFKASYTDEELKAAIVSARILEDYLLSRGCNHQRPFIHHSSGFLKKIKNVLSIPCDIIVFCIAFCQRNIKRDLPDKAFTRKRGIGSHKESSFCCCGKRKMDDVGGCGNVAAQHGREL